MRHTRYGWWLEEAGPIEATSPLDGDTTADVVVVGGGYLGLWTAWHLCGTSRSSTSSSSRPGSAGPAGGRNGGFVDGLWDKAPTLRERPATQQPPSSLAPAQRGVAGDRRLVRGARSRRLVLARRRTLGSRPTKPRSDGERRRGLRSPRCGRTRSGRSSPTSSASAALAGFPAEP